MQLIALLLVLFAGAATSCGGGAKNVDMSEPWHISLAPTEQKGDVAFPNLSEMVDDIEYVKLEYVPEIPVGYIWDTPIITNDYIVISDRNQGVLQYSRDGKFIRRIGHIGRGPGEYGGVNKIKADEKRGIVYIFHINKAIKYELATGKFIEDTIITGTDDISSFMWRPLSPVSITDSVWFMSQEGATVSLLGEIYPVFWPVFEVPEMRIIHVKRGRLYDNPPAGDILLRPTPTWRDSRGRVNFYENLTDTMFVVSADGSTFPRIIPDFGPQGLKAPVGGDTGAYVDRVMESGRYILFEGNFRYMNYMVSFEKMTGKRGLHTKRNHVGTIDNLWGPDNDIDGGFSKFKQYDENIWWASYNAYDMLEKLTPEHFESVRGSVKYPDRLEKLQTFVSTSKENDNPVIVIAKLKD